MADPTDKSGVDPLKDAMNTERYTGSIKHNFYEEKPIIGTATDDRVQLRGKKPHFKRIDKSLSLNFDGRVKKASRKNIQMVRIVHSTHFVGIQIQSRWINKKGIATWKSE